MRAQAWWNTKLWKKLRVQSDPEQKNLLPGVTGEAPAGRQLSLDSRLYYKRGLSAERSSSGRK